jgi:hypothetical protein
VSLLLFFSAIDAQPNGKRTIPLTPLQRKKTRTGRGNFSIFGYPQPFNIDEGLENAIVLSGIFIPFQVIFTTLNY